MSTLTQFFSGGGGGSAKIPAEILVVGGGAAAHSHSFSASGISPFYTPGSSFGFCYVPGASGGVIYGHSMIQPGTTCPVQVGSGHPVATACNCSYNGPTPGVFTNNCSYSFYAGGGGGASFFGGSSQLCAAGGCSCYQVFTPFSTPYFTCTYTCQGQVYSRSGNLNLPGCGGSGSIFDAKNLFNPCIAGGGQIGPGYNAQAGAGRGNPLDNTNDCVPNVSPFCGGGCFNTLRSQASGFASNILGFVEVFGGASFGQGFGPGNPTYQPVACPAGPRTYFPGLHLCCNYGGANTGGGGHWGAGCHPCSPDPTVNTPCQAGRAGTVIIKYPTDFAAAPSFPGACDCSPQTPGFRTYRFVSSGSITLP